MFYDQKINHGLSLLSKGQLQEADNIFCDVLTKEPNFSEAFYGRACVARAAGNHALAIGFAGQAIEIKPQSHYYIPLGLSLYEQGHSAEGEAALKSSLLLNPYDPRAYHALALVYEAMGNQQGAEHAFRKAIELQPSSLTYWKELIRFYYQAEAFEQALNIAKDAVKNNVGKIEFMHELGVLLYKMGILGEAERVFRKIIRLNLNIISAYANLGAILFQLNRLQEAKKNLVFALEHEPEVIETQVNLGLVQMGLGALSEAKELLQSAYQKAPLDARIGLNLGTILFELRMLDDAETIYRHLLTPSEFISLTEQEYHKIEYNLSMVLLAKGNVIEGYEHMEARHSLLNHFVDSDHIPIWDGKEPAETLLVRAEQGLGDTLQFIRYLPALLQQYSIVIEVQKELVHLLELIVSSCQSDHSCVVVEKNSVLPEGITHQVMLMSLPYLLQAQEIPQYQLRLETCQSQHISDGLKVGLCWMGNRDNHFDLLRSIPLSNFSSLLDSHKIAFYALQIGLKKSDMPKGFVGALPCGDLLRTAFFIQQLDLVITVDTMIAHLAGILGKPVWLLNRYGGDWRWYPTYQNENNNSLWYPTLRIFQQKQPLPPDQAWNNLMEEVKAELATIL
ncbi:tetratricopeptide repeat protein [Commensalibacter nepenthis]|uniref:Tetratricopeptide repeat protein n=1 Tax=Commensalibacter nepenthis TaxID=3043872 RepID=A0ABT6QBE7_9PROT|nr:tetratricopeptide repeat protein [Commensalibacter sp. TBRC 10068]MDI2113640.1 tetratricopeptide repeat protein [Commensalibacter sp. TBRC 10068]